MANTESPKFQLEACPCCLADFGEKDVVAKMPCGHQMHIACFAQYQTRDSLVSRGCPFCAKKFDRAETQPEGEEGEARQRRSALESRIAVLESKEQDVQMKLSVKLQKLREIPDDSNWRRMKSSYPRGGTVASVFAGRDVIITDHSY